MATETREMRPGMRETVTGTAPQSPQVSRRLAVWRRPARVLTATTSGLVRMVWWLVAAVVALLAFDFLFRLIGAADTGFAHGVYLAGATLSSPFTGIFARMPRFGSYVLTWSDVAAAVACVIVGWALVRVISAQARRIRRLR